VKEGAVDKDVTNWNQGQPEAAFAAGKAAMMINGPWNFGNLNAVTGLNYGAVEIPVNTPGQAVVGPIGGDLRDQTGKFAALMTIKQIDQAVVVVRNGAPTEPGASSCRTHPPRAKNIYGSQRDRRRNLSDRTRRASRET